MLQERDVRNLESNVVERRFSGVYIGIRCWRRRFSRDITLIESHTDLCCLIGF